MKKEIDVAAKAQLVNRNYVEGKTKEAAEADNLLYYDLRSCNLQTELLEKFKSDDFFNYSFIPIDYEEGILIVGSPNPKAARIDDLKKNYEKEFPKISVAYISNESFKDNEEMLKTIIQAAKPEGRGEIDISQTLNVEKKSFEQFQEAITEAEIQNLLKVLIAEGYAIDASDIHIEPVENEAKLRLRLDGVLHIAGMLTKEKYQYVRSQVELKSGLKLNVNYPQNGRFRVKIDDIDLSVRVEVMPSLFGDDIVIRMFNVQTQLLDTAKLGIRDVQMPLLEQALLRPHGMILLVGPTGSGKTTTIYSILNRLNKPEIKMITLEDPIEYTLPGAVQSQINEGEGFNDRLRAVLREDPDVIMVGEIRDDKTAKTALQGAITGHLLISSLHANDAVTAIPRIIGLTEDASSFLDAVNVIIAQRLVRKICKNCISEYTPTEEEWPEIQRIMDSLSKSHKPTTKPMFFMGKGCEFCNEIGYKGRLGIFEFLRVSPAFEKAVKEDSTLHELKILAQSEGMVSMEQDGFLKAIEGIASISEVLKVIKE